MSNEQNNNTNSHSNSAQNDFDGKLQELIKQIESIRKIKLITESEYGSILLMKEELAKKQNEIEGLKKENDNLKKDKREKDDLNSRINELEKELNEEMIKRGKHLWWTIWIFAGVFLFFALGLFIGVMFLGKENSLIPLLIGGGIIISILALIIVFFGKTIRQIIDNTNKKVL